MRGQVLQYDSRLRLATETLELPERRQRGNPWSSVERPGVAPMTLRSLQRGVSGGTVVAAYPAVMQVLAPSLVRFMSAA